MTLEEINKLADEQQKLLNRYFNDCLAIMHTAKHLIMEARAERNKYEALIRDYDASDDH